MNVQKFNLLANELGYTKTESTASKNIYAGVWHDFPVTLALGLSTLANQAQKLPVFTIYLPKSNETGTPADKSHFTKIAKTLRSELKKDKVNVIFLNNQLHLILLKAKNLDNPDLLNTMWRMVKQTLDAEQIYARYSCPVCNQADCNAMFFDENNALIPIHNSCKHHLVEKKQQEYIETEKNAKNIQGMIGLLVGGLLGALVNVFTIVALDTEFMILYALIPLASFFGFKLLGGQPGIIPTIVTAIWSILQVFIVMVIYGYYYFEGFYSVGEVIEILFYDMGAFIEMTWFGFISVGVGLIPTVLEGLNTADKKAKDFEKSMENLMNYSSLSQDNLNHDSIIENE